MNIDKKDNSTTELDGLLRDDSSRIIYGCIAGSHAYGTAHEDSDEDIRGIFIHPQSAYLALEDPAKQISDEKGDIVYYALQRFIELAMNANPNIIELLFMPEDCVKLRTRYMDKLIEARSLFITRQAYESHVGYAQAQIKRARGRNKWINNPQPEEQPLKEDFCWFIPRDRNEEGWKPYQPRPLKESGVNLSECHAASLEHIPDVYRIYHYGAGARGVFRNEILVCESIPREDEAARCIGLLKYDKAGFEKAMRDFQNYWEWRNKRNENRWRSQERGEIDYDAKNMMHTFRLLLSGEHILRAGFPLVRFSGADLKFLKDIIAGRFEYHELIGLAEKKTADLGQLHKVSMLPDRPDPEKATALLRSITAEWEADHA